MGIPDSIKEKPFFVGWNYITRSGKQTKTPINPHTGKNAKSNDPATWGTYEQAKAAVSEHHLEGFGIMFAKDNGLVGVDIDHCYDPETKTFNETATAILERCKTFTEFSPSGKGLHLYFLAPDKPSGGCKNSDTGVEMYSRARFFTLTENQVEGTPDEIAQDNGELQWILDTFIEKQKKQSKKEAKGSRSFQFEDDEIIERAKTSKTGDRFTALFEGRWQNDYGSQSEADLAFCSMLAFWTGRNVEQMDRIFRSSALMRGKWDERHSTSGSTYGQDTISKACEGCEETYSPSEEGPILISSGRYVRCRGEAVYPITNFIIEPGEQIITEDEDQLTATFLSCSREKLKLIFMSSDFSSTQKFKGMLNRNTIALSFDGSDSDLEALKVYLSGLKWNRKAGVKSLGLHEHEGRWVFVDCDGAVEKGEKKVENIVQLSKYRNIRTDILSHRRIEKDELVEVLNYLMNYNEPAKTIPILGWCAGAFLKARLAKIGVKFPHLALIGEAGSGKSSTEEFVIMPIFGCDKATAASQVTAFTLMRESASSNLVPQLMDEFKPSKLSEAKVSALYNHFRDVYDGHDGQRGRSDQSIAVYELTAPIVFAGEESPQEAAIRERTIQTLFSKKDLKNKDFKRTINSLAAKPEALGNLGFTLLMGALELRDAEIEAWHEMGMSAFPEEFPTRVVNNLSCCLSGLLFLRKICQALGVEWDRSLPYSLDECKEALTYCAREYLLDGGTHNRSAVEEALEIMSRIPTLIYRQDYVVNETEGLLLLHFPGVYDKYTKYRKEYDIRGEILTYTEFSRQLQHSELFLQKGKQVFDPTSRHNTKMWVLDFNLLKDRCDVSTFLEHKNDGGFST